MELLSGLPFPLAALSSVCLVGSGLLLKSIRKAPLVAPQSVNQSVSQSVSRSYLF